MLTNADSNLKYYSFNPISQLSFEVFELVWFPLNAVPVSKIEMNPLFLDCYFFTRTIKESLYFIASRVRQNFLFGPVFTACIDYLQTEPVSKTSLKVNAASITRQITYHKTASSYLCNYFVIYIVNVFDIVNLHSFIS